jgi:transcription-repair coupling factor (superfamily II helicase)
LDLARQLESTRPVADLARALEAGGRLIASGAAGSSSVFLAGALARRTGRPVVLVMAHVDEAEAAEDELASDGCHVIRLPALESLPGETGVALDLFADRLRAVRAAGEEERREERGERRGQRSKAPTVIIASIHALMQAVPHPGALDELTRTIARADRLDPQKLVGWLDTAGYSRTGAVEEPGEYAVRGGIVDIYPPAGSVRTLDGAEQPAAPVRLDFFGDEVDRIHEIDLDTMGSDRELQSVELLRANLDAQEHIDGGNFLDLLPGHALALVAETLEVTEQGRGYYERVTDSRGVYGPPAVLKLLRERFAGFAEINQFSGGGRAGGESAIDLPVRPLPMFDRDAAKAVGELEGVLDEIGAEGRLVVPCDNPAELQRFGELLTEFGGEWRQRIDSRLGYVDRGFIFEPQGQPPLAVVPLHELLHRFGRRRRAARLRAGGGRAMDTFLEFSPGDFVVHTEHGIARFVGLTTLKKAPLKSATAAPTSRKSKAPKAEPEEYLTLEFAGKSRLHVPATQIDLVQRYVGGFSGAPPLSTLGGERWKQQKRRVSESVRELASELLRVRAAREATPGVRYAADTAWQKEFEAEFPYEETEDQLAALAAIKRDMQSDRPMDRLICGDVGFGKTEVAIRAAFKAVEFGKQVAVLVPTTVLAEQHERTFRERFAAYPFRIESLSRFKTGGEISKTLALLRKGQVDVVIGTHRLLSKDIRFSDLGLVIIDEEQRFGVEHKEQLLRLRLTADVLTLSATPIPRTLHMSMLGLRDISSLATPPLDRQAVVTDVIPWNERRLKQAMDRELSREGQIFYVHNRVHDIKVVADEVQKLAPQAKIVVGHGQMPSRELERVMLAFTRREADILVSTTIIESGIDIPTANTMIIDNADRFGLADLHQLRGRVGRSRHRGYCYLLLPNDRVVSEVAKKRLKAIEQYAMLGAGFKIAMRDLEIRGAGNLLGAEQSGHIAAVGYEMYCQLLERAVTDLTDETAPEPARTTLEIGVRGMIPPAYIPSDVRRMDAYRRLATAPTAAAVEQVRHDLVEAYGEPPGPVKRLLDLAEARALVAAAGVRAIAIRGSDVVFTCDDAAHVAARLSGSSGTVRALDGEADGAGRAEVYFRPPAEYLRADTLLALLRARFSSVSPAQTAPAPMI